MGTYHRFWFTLACIFLGSWELGSVPDGLTRPLGVASGASEAASGRGSAGSDSELMPEQELEKTRKAVLADRPYKKDYNSAKELITLKILPSTLATAGPVPDWWSDKQSYDLARLYALALSHYPVFSVSPPENWNQKVLAQEGLATLGTDSSPASLSSSASLGRSSRLDLGERQLETSFDVDYYSFQYMPVKRRGIGFGFFAITNKECATETFMRSSVVLGSGHSQHSPMRQDVMMNLAGDKDDKVFYSRMIVNKTGGTSLNVNFLVGGAGGGNFNTPEKPLKKIIYESIVDGAEAAFCLAVNNKQCFDYYSKRPSLQPTKLTDKQRKKVGSC